VIEGVIERLFGAWRGGKIPPAHRPERPMDIHFPTGAWLQVNIHGLFKGA
jgi:hypothetical protein